MLKPSSQNIGKKIKYFRKRQGLTQMDLELELSASIGSISRMENGEVNPSKETLLNIAKVLGLNAYEISYLLDFHDVEEDQRLIQNAINKVKESFSSPLHFYYLIDDKYRVIYLSAATELLAKILGLDTKQIINNHVEEIVFDKSFGVRNLISKDGFDNIAISVLAPWAHERSFLFQEEWCKSLFNRLEKLPEFSRLWEFVKNNRVDIYSEEFRSTYFSIFNKKIRMVYTFTHLLDDTRFIIIELKFTGLPLLNKSA